MYRDPHASPIEPGFESCAAVLNFGQVFNSTLLQITKLFELIHGYNTVVDICLRIVFN